MPANGGSPTKVALTAATCPVGNGVSIMACFAPRGIHAPENVLYWQRVQGD
jgi:hypothetical protein